MEETVYKERSGGPVVWITGASSGLGEALAREYARAGFSLALTARRESRLEELRDELGDQFNTKVASYQGDVADADRMQEICEQIEDELGPIELLIANAGTHEPTRVENFDSLSTKRLMEINYLGVVYAVAAVLPKFIERKKGRVAGVSSLAGYRGLPEAAAYSASKAAVTAFLEGLRLDLDKYGIPVTIISPGFVKTPLTDKNDFPMPFLMEVDEAAKAMYKGIERSALEVSFPLSFALIMKLLRIMPHCLYYLITKKLVVR